MSFSIYTASAPVFVRMLSNLSAILDKAEAHCSERKIAPEALLQFRLYPDMYPLVRQVQIATDMTKGAAARLAQAEVPSYADTEVTFDDLRARLAKTIDFIKSLKPEQFDGAAGRELGGAHMVEEDEGADHPPRRHRQQSPHDEIAEVMLARPDHQSFGHFVFPSHCRRKCA